MIMNSKARRRRRPRISDVMGEERGAYFLAPPSSYTFVHSGASTLDCTLGGGWPLTRVSNIIGDKSTGKTLLAIEGMTNFTRMFPKKIKARYAESEEAFEEDYAAALGMPLDRVSRPSEPLEIVEDFFDDLSDYLKVCKRDGAGFYVLDSLDSLSDAEEIKKDMEKGSYGTGKAKKMSQAFRRTIREIGRSKCHLMVISQVRSNIGVAFGKNYTRSGGRALDFYASQIIYLAHKGEIRQTRNGIKRTVGVDIKVKCTKNKIGLPFRTCEFPIIFGFGIEDICASINWILENKQTSGLDMSIKELNSIKRSALRSELGDEIDELRKTLSSHVSKRWTEVERAFIPTRGKYS